MNNLTIETHRYQDASTAVRVIVNGHIVATANCPAGVDVAGFIAIWMATDEVQVAVNSMTRPTPVQVPKRRAYDPVVVWVLAILVLGVLVAAVCR